MSIINKVFKYICNSDYRFDVNSSYGLNKFMNDERYIKRKFNFMMGYPLPLDNPKTFNEKLQWLKLHDRKRIYTRLVDKYEVKKIIANRLGKEYIVPTIGVWDSFKEIPFDDLPDSFVLKCTHDSGGVIICDNKSKFDREFARKKINKSLKKNFYYYGREWPYKNVKPRIIAEPLLKDNKKHTDDLRDYKFFCFNGKVKFFKVDFDRFIKHGANYFDTNLRLLKFGEKTCPPNYQKEIFLPDAIRKMILLAEKLSFNIPFVRIDFYYVDDTIKFGEMTFFPASGFGPFIPEEADRKIGDYLNILS